MGPPFEPGGPRLVVPCSELNKEGVLLNCYSVTVLIQTLSLEGNGSQDENLPWRNASPETGVRTVYSGGNN
jgi:hypothetical protein